MNSTDNRRVISCDSCAMMTKERLQPTDVHPLMICRAMPPSPLIVQQMTPQGPVMNIQTMFPVVSSSHWCFMHRTTLQSPAAGANPAAVKGPEPVKQSPLRVVT